MKKIIYSIALIAILTGCNKSEKIELSKNNIISFSSLNNRITKAANDLKGEYAADYKVYAFSPLTPNLWYIDDVVSGTTNTATNSYYWPIGDNERLNFYSYAPNNAIIEEKIETPSAVTFKYTVTNDAQEDFTIAEPLIDYTKESADSKANFTFKHKLSKVTVVAQLNQDLLDAGYIIDNGVIYESSITVNNNKASVDVLNCSLTPINNTLGTQFTYNKDNCNTYYIMPQQALGCKVLVENITVKHKNGSLMFSGNLDEIIIDNTHSIDEFIAGTHYTLTVTLSSNGLDLIPIKFTADESIWSNGSGNLVQ